MERPFQAYEGDEPYVFVCYAHEDKVRVYPELVRLREAGYHLWYDEGISPGSEWSDALARHIEGCAVFLYYVTPRSVVSEHCRREVNFALEQPCGMLAVHLEPTGLPSGLRLTLSNRQAILKYDEPTAVYEAKLAAAIRDAQRRDVEESSTSALMLGDWTLDVGTQRLSRQDECHALDPKVLSVLLHLIDRAPEVVSRQGLIDRTWPDVVVGENVLDQAIAQLRRALGDDARDPKYIETLPRRGYRLVAPLDTSMRGEPLAVDGTARQRTSPDEPTAPSSRRPSARWWIGTAVAMVVALGVIAWLLNRPATEGPSLDMSVAVLPFSVVGADPKTSTYADALTEELRTTVAGYQELETVSARDASAPGQAKRASYAVGGNVQRLGDHVRLRVSLTRSTDDHTVWSETFDRPWPDARADPAELAVTVGRFTRFQLLMDCQCEDVRRRSRSEGAAAALCAARAEQLRAVQTGDVDPRLALNNARRAVALDPDLPDGHILVANLYTMLGENGRMDWQDATREAHAALDRVAILAPGAPWILMARAQTQILEFNYGVAEANYRKVLANPLFPNDWTIEMQLGHIARARGDLTEAIDRYSRALRIYDAGGLLYVFYAGTLWFDGQHRAAIEATNAGLRLFEVGINRYYLLVVNGLAHEALAETESARAAFVQAIDSVEPTWRVAAALPLARLHRDAEARELLARFETTDNPPVEHMVEGYAALGDPRAFEWIDRAIDRHVGTVCPNLRSSPLFSELRKDPRWAEVMARLEAEEAKGSMATSSAS